MILHALSCTHVRWAQACCAQGVPVAVSGGLAGCAFWTAALPADVVKTRLQTDLSNRLTSISTLAAIAKEQGGNTFRSAELIRIYLVAFRVQRREQHCAAHDACDDEATAP